MFRISPWSWCRVSNALLIAVARSVLIFSSGELLESHLRGWAKALAVGDIDNIPVNIRDLPLCISHAKYGGSTGCRLSFARIPNRPPYLCMLPVVSLNTSGKNKLAVNQPYQKRGYRSIVFRCVTHLPVPGYRKTKTKLSQPFLQKYDVTCPIDWPGNHLRHRLKRDLYRFQQKISFTISGTHRIP